MVVKFRDDPDVVEFIRPTFIDNILKEESTVRPRGVWLIDVEVGELIPSDFLNQVFDGLNKKNTKRSVRITVQDGLTGEDRVKEVRFVYG